MPTREGRYTLRPELLTAVADLVADFAGQKVSLFSIDRVRLLSECPTDPTLVSIRQAASNGIDIDLCNEQGDVCAMQVRGLQYEAAEAVAMQAPAFSQRSRNLGRSTLATEVAFHLVRSAGCIKFRRKVTLAATDEVRAERSHSPSGWRDTC